MVGFNRFGGKKRHARWLQRVLFLCGVLCAGISGAEETENWNAKFQSTYVWQRQDAFDAAYSGTNSLLPDRAKSYSFSATAAFGWRPWSGGELYYDEEAVQGVALSGQTGLGGFSNGEIARTSGPHLKFYRARFFLRQTWDLGDARDAVDSDANQLAGSVAKRRLVLTVGNLSVLDIFANNTYSHDPRTQFLNLAMMTYGAYDYAADARGYSRGLALEWYADEWVLRGGRFLQPKEANGKLLDPSLRQHYGDQLEIEHAHTLGDLPGKLQLLGFRNHAKMARFSDALSDAALHGGPPDINRVRNGDQTKRGFGVNLEQALAADLGLFTRYSRSDGKTETYAFTEIDRSLSTGLVLRGSAWGRAQDAVGLAFARDGLSKAHRDYLAAGGLGFFLGDGRLDYRQEAIVETYYNLEVSKYHQLTLDWQRIANPGYNADRGPVNLFALRLHTEF